LTAALAAVDATVVMKFSAACVVAEYFVIQSAASVEGDYCTAFATGDFATAEVGLAGKPPVAKAGLQTSHSW